MSEMDIWINILSNLIIKTYFQDSNCLFIFTDKENAFQYVGDLPVVNVETKMSNLSPNIFLQHFGCHGIIIRSDHPVSQFKSFEREIKFAKERFNSRKFLLLPGNNMKENFSDILQCPELMYVADLDIVELTNNDNGFIFTIWTHFYVGIKSEEKKVLDVWFSNNSTFLYENNLYPDKLSNQMGRNIRMATFLYEPYSIVGKYTFQFSTVLGFHIIVMYCK